MTQPPQDGFGGPRPPDGSPSGGRTPPPQPPPPPTQPPTQPPGYGYPQQPQQPPQTGQSYGYPGPYGQQQPGYGYGYPPPPPPSSGPSGPNGRLVAIIASAAVALLLVVGGVYLAVGDDDGGGTAQPKPSPSTSSEPEPDPTRESPLEPTEEPTEDFDDETPGPHSKEDGFQGQWQSEGGKTLTIGAKAQSGDAAGKNSVSYIDAGGEGICIGIGDERSGGATFRTALRCGGKDSKKYIAGNATQDGDSLTIIWDKGGSDTLDWNGRR